MAVQDLAQLKVTSYWRDPIIIVGAGPIGMITALGLPEPTEPPLLHFSRDLNVEIWPAETLC